MFFYREAQQSLVKPSDPVRYLFDASDESSLTLQSGFEADPSGIFNIPVTKATAWRSTGTNTANATATELGFSPIYDSTNKSLRFYATNKTGFYNFYFYNIGNSSPNISTPNWHMFAVVNAANVTLTNAVYDNHAIFNFAQYGGIYLVKSGDNACVQGHVYDGNHNSSPALAGVQLNTKTLVEAKSTGGIVGAAINGGSFQSSAAGNTANSSDWMTGIGRTWIGNIANLSASIHEIVVFNDDLNDTSRDAWTSYLKSKWGV